MQISPTMIAILILPLVVGGTAALAIVIVRALVREYGPTERRVISHASWIAAIMIIIAESFSAVVGIGTRPFEVIVAMCLILIAVGTGGLRDRRQTPRIDRPARHDEYDPYPAPDYHDDVR